MSITQDKGLTMIKYLLHAVIVCFFATAMQSQAQTTVGGYGELHYNEPEGSTKGELDFHRFVIYFGHEFNDWISFHSELELEHVFFEAGEGPGELGLEQAYVEFQPWERYGFRGGIMLIPAGIINHMHEPPTFHGVERPRFHNSIIPTTWREAGLGFYGKPHDMVAFQLYYTSSLDASGFSLSSGLRGGRTAAARPKTSDMALSGRVDVYPIPGLIVGGAFFTGTTTRGNEDAGDGTVTLIAGDVRYSIGNLELRAEGSTINIGDTEKLRDALNVVVAEQISGYYGEAAYNFLAHLAPATDQKLYVFARYELLNTEASVAGLDPDGTYERNELTVGITYKPAPDVAVKIDYQSLGSAKDGSKAAGQFNAGVGYAF